MAPRQDVGRAVIELTVDELARRALDTVRDDSRHIIGIVGAPGAGKSTTTHALGQALGDRAAVVPMDGFHLDDAVLVALGRRRRKGAPDTFDVAGYVALLRRLRDRTDEVVYAPRFDRTVEASFAGAIPVPRSVPLVITEGNWLLHDADGWQAVRAQLDEVWFLDVPADERRRRLVGRRVAHGEDDATALRWVEGVDEPNAAVVDACRERADIVVRIVAEAS